MALRVKALNADASFMLQFNQFRSDSIAALHPTPTHTPTQPLTIILDPWLCGSSTILHKKFSISTHSLPPCVTSMAELPEPDVVIISQAKTDHCHRETLTQLPQSGGKFVILAEPTAARLIRSWKIFPADKVISLPKYRPETDCVYTVLIPRTHAHGLCGQLTVALLSQKIDIAGLFKTVGITYTPARPFNHYADYLDTSPTNFASNTLVGTHSSRYHSGDSISVLFAPHGTSMGVLKPWVDFHLRPRGTFPLTALLHCFDKVKNPFYLGGTICQGFDGASKLVAYLEPRSWISCHDGAKVVKGLANFRLEVTKYSCEEVASMVSPMGQRLPDRPVIDVIALRIGEEKLLRAPAFTGLGP